MTNQPHTPELRQVFTHNRELPINTPLCSAFLPPSILKIGARKRIWIPNKKCFVYFDGFSTADCSMNIKTFSEFGQGRVNVDDIEGTPVYYGDIVEYPYKSKVKTMVILQFQGGGTWPDFSGWWKEKPIIKPYVKIVGNIYMKDYNEKKEKNA